MNTKIRFDENDGKKEKTIVGLSVIFRREDILIVDGRSYVVGHAEYDIEKNEATYWLNEGEDDSSVSATNVKPSKLSDVLGIWLWGIPLLFAVGIIVIFFYATMK